jgi:23S rRNA (cytosine1962-C5)-methyltransferase
VGLFLDMRQTRQWLRERASGKNVLNLFAYTCAFSVAALAGGAQVVVNNDMSRRALDWGRLNHQLNGQDTTRVRMLPHDLFRSWGKLRRHGGYDLIVIDPPTNQRGSFVAEKQYSLILKRLPELCRPGAQVVACLNSPFLNADYVPQQMARWCPDCRLLGQMPAAVDFPDRYPDRGLKISLFRYEGAGRSGRQRVG